MNNELLKDHPGIAFGAWLKAKRQARGIIARIFAGQIWLSPAQYAEVEVGVVGWVGDKQDKLIPLSLDFEQPDHSMFKKLLKLARAGLQLTFDKIFTPEELKPVRAAHSQGKQMTKLEEDALLALVFKPLPA